METASPETLRVAQGAFENLKKGLATGEFEAFLDRCTDDITFWFPAGSFKGMNKGKDKLAAFFLRVSTVYPGGLELTLLQRTSNVTNVLFEVRSKGVMFTVPYENQAAIALEVRGDKICSYREYLGAVFQLGQ